MSKITIHNVFYKQTEKCQTVLDMINLILTHCVDKGRSDTTRCGSSWSSPRIVTFFLQQNAFISTLSQFQPISIQLSLTYLLPWLLFDFSRNIVLTHIRAPFQKEPLSICEERVTVNSTGLQLKCRGVGIFTVLSLFSIFIFFTLDQLEKSHPSICSFALQTYDKKVGLWSFLQPTLNCRRA